MSFFGGRRQVEPPSPAPQRPEAPPAVLTAPQTPVGFETVLGANSIMEGTLRSNANIRLDGTFSGTLEITGNVLVGETARITADINAKNVSIAGAVRGNISGKKVQLLRTGRIWGDIRAQALTTEEGAFIDGKITMTGQEQDAEPAAQLGDDVLDVPEEVVPAVTATVEDVVGEVVDEAEAAEDEVAPVDDTQPEIDSEVEDEDAEDKPEG